MPTDSGRDRGKATILASGAVSSAPRHRIDDTAGVGTVATGAVAASVAESPSFARVISDHPSAVLLVDLDERAVVYVNGLGRQFAPDVALPMDIDQWARAAGLRTSGGDEIGDSPTPLHKVAEGTPVRGELITAERESDVSVAREDLWVVGFPLSDAPEPLSRRALVVILPVRDVAAVADARAAGDELRHRAVTASELSFAISDPNAEDDPLVWVNPAFERATGYSSDEVLGRNCRFLQGPLTDRDTVRRIREALRANGSVNEVLLNYRADGTVFWNHLVISPVFDTDGRLTHHVAIQTDVTERVAADETRRVALAEVEAANERLRTQAGISQALNERLAESENLLVDLPTLLARHLSGWIVAVGLQGARVTQLSIAGGQGTRSPDDIPDGLREHVVRGWFAGPGRWVVDAAGTPGSQLWPVTVAVEPAELAPLLVDAGVDVEASSLPRWHFAVTVMPGRSGVLGLIGTGRPEPYDEAELTVLADLGRRTGLAVENAMLYLQEHDNAVTLQRSLLPKLPQLASFEVAADYIASGAAADVGGDWYDVLDLPGPWIGVAVGDVMGHDMAAAATMGQLRAMVRTLAWGGARPAELITRLDELVREFDPSQLATFLYALLDDPVAHDGRCVVHYSNAGHPPAVLKRPDGGVELLDAAVTAPIGVPFRPEAGTPMAVTELPLGGSLVLYTDGLVERRDRDLDQGIRTLMDLVESLPTQLSADQMRARIADELVNLDHADDTCLLVVRRTV